MENLLHQHREALLAACESAQVDALYAFGSVLTSHFSPSSDLDFIVSISEEDPLEYTERYFQLKFDLEQIFQREIDLLEEKAIRNPIFRERVNKEKQLIYARGDYSVAQ
jgi:uncharacterized protein